MPSSPLPTFARSSAVSSLCWPVVRTTPVSGRRNLSKSARANQASSGFCSMRCCPCSALRRKNSGPRPTTLSCGCPGVTAATRSGTSRAGPRWASSRPRGSPRWQPSPGAMSCETELDKAWKNLLVAQHHDIQICGLLADARKFLPESIRSSQDVTTRSLQYLASRMASGGFQQVVVFNPVSWRRQAWIEVPVAFEKGYAKSLEVRHDGKIVPAVVLSADSYSDGSLREAKLAVLADLDGLSVGVFELRPTTAGAPTKRSGRGARLTARIWRSRRRSGRFASSRMGAYRRSKTSAAGRSSCGRRRRVACSRARSMDGT